MKKIIPILLLASILFSCKDALEELSTIGTFTSTLTGDVEKQFDGTAAFVHSIKVNTTPNGSSLAVILSKTTNQSEFIALTLSDDSTNGIPAGTFSLASTGSGVLFVPVYVTATENYAFPDVSKTNQVVISSVGDTQVKGTFEVNLIDIDTQKAVKITGTFNALGKTEND
jgi:hypothetical protein